MRKCLDWKGNCASSLRPGIYAGTHIHRHVHTYTHTFTPTISTRVFRCFPVVYWTHQAPFARTHVLYSIAAGEWHWYLLVPQIHRSAGGRLTEVLPTNRACDSVVQGSLILVNSVCYFFLPFVAMTNRDVHNMQSNISDGQ